MSYSYQFRLKIIKLVTEQDYGIREVAKLHQISHALVIYWLKAFRERGLDGVKSPYTNLQTPKIVQSKMKKKDIKIPETTDFSPKAFKKLQRELALARAEIAYLKDLEALDRQKQRQKKEKRHLKKNFLNKNKKSIIYSLKIEKYYRNQKQKKIN